MRPPLRVPAVRPEVAVVTVVRNEVELIDACARSVQGQEGVAWEWVVLDNASDDGTWERLCALAAEDGRIRPVRSETNLRQSKGLERIAPEVRAPYAAMLDGDDVALPGRLRLSLERLRANPRRVALYGDAEFIDAAGRPLPPWFIARDAVALRRIAEFVMPAIHSTSCWRTDWLRACVFPGRDSTMCHDYYLLTRALEDGEVDFLPQALAAYRVHSKSVSRTQPLVQLAVGSAIALLACTRRRGRSVAVDDLMAWAQEVGRDSRTPGDVHLAVARRAARDAALRLALYHARKAVRAGRWAGALVAGRVLLASRPSDGPLGPLLRGGLLAAAGVDGRGRSRVRGPSDGPASS